MSGLLSVLLFFSAMFGLSGPSPLVLPDEVVQESIEEKAPEESVGAVVEVPVVESSSKKEVKKVKEVIEAPQEKVAGTKTFAVGDWVEYLYYGEWYQGQITSMPGDRCVVNDAGFNSGDPYFNQSRLCDDLRPYTHSAGVYEFAIGQTVEAKWEYAWYEAVVVSREGDRYTVRSTDGYDWEWEVPWFLMR